MKVVILLFLLASALGEEEISLEDIEKDNLRVETKVHGKPKNAKKNAYPLNQTQPQNYEESKNHYENDLQVQRQNAEVNPQAVQYYSDVSKGETLTSHEPNQLAYPSEVQVGNHLQSIQQKAEAEKYLENRNKNGGIFVTIPMDQLLSYYPNLGVGQINAKSRAQLLLYGTNAESLQHIAAPVYTPSFSQKVAYQIQPQQYLSHTSPHQQHSQAAIPAAKASKSLYDSPKSYAYIQQSHPRYVQQVIYAKPRMLYAQGTPVYTDLYAPTPTYVQDNSLYSQAQSHQAYVSSGVAEQLAKYVLDETRVNTASPNHVKKVLPSTSSSFVPPQYNGEKFRSGVTQLHPISSGNELYSGDPAADEPKSLLDSYVPSYVSYVSDSNRYEEKPIKLEGGFLPSKINFIRGYKKRKIE